MPQVRANSEERWVRRTSAATQDYVAGVQAPRSDWQTATIAAAANHTVAMQQALAEKRFEKGVRASSTEVWKRKTTTKGAERFSGGVSAAEADYKTAVAPYLEVITNTRLPDRGPTGDAKNYERVKVMGMALRAKKIGR